MARTFSTLLAVACLVALAQATTWYISPYGNQNNNGTSPQEPMLTPPGTKLTNTPSAGPVISSSQSKEGWSDIRLGMSDQDAGEAAPPPESTATSTRAYKSTGNLDAFKAVAALVKSPRGKRKKSSGKEKGSEQPQGPKRRATTTSNVGKSSSPRGDQKASADSSVSKTPSKLSRALSKRTKSTKRLFELFQGQTPEPQSAPDAESSDLPSPSSSAGLTEEQTPRSGEEAAVKRKKSKTRSHRTPRKEEDPELSLEEKQQAKQARKQARKDAKKLAKKEAKKEAKKKAKLDAAEAGGAPASERDPSLDEEGKASGADAKKAETPESPEENIAPPEESVTDVEEIAGAKEADSSPRGEDVLGEDSGPPPPLPPEPSSAKVAAIRAASRGKLPGVLQIRAAHKGDAAAKQSDSSTDAREVGAEEVLPPAADVEGLAGDLAAKEGSGECSAEREASEKSGTVEAERKGQDTSPCEGETGKETKPLASDEGAAPLQEAQKSEVPVSGRKDNQDAKEDGSKEADLKGAVESSGIYSLISASTDAVLEASSTAEELASENPEAELASLVAMASDVDLHSSDTFAGDASAPKRSPSSLLPYAKKDMLAAIASLQEYDTTGLSESVAEADTESGTRHIDTFAATADDGEAVEQDVASLDDDDDGVEARAGRGDSEEDDDDDGDVAEISESLVEAKELSEKQEREEGDSEPAEAALRSPRYFENMKISVVEDEEEAMGVAPLGMCDILIKCAGVMRKLRVPGAMDVQNAVPLIREIMVEEGAVEAAPAAGEEVLYGLYYDPFSDENIEFQRKQEADGMELRRGSMRFKQQRMRLSLADAYVPPPATPPPARRGKPPTAGEHPNSQSSSDDRGQPAANPMGGGLAPAKSKELKRTRLAQRLGIQGRSISTASLWREYANIQEEADQPFAATVAPSPEVTATAEGKLLVDKETQEFFDTERNRASSTFDLATLISSALSKETMVGLWLQPEKKFSAYNIPRGAVIDLKADDRKNQRMIAASHSYHTGTKYGGKMNYIRVYDDNKSYKTLYQPCKTPAHVLCAELAEKFVINDWENYCLFLVKEGNETILGDDSTPLELLEKMPTSEVDRVRFVFKDAGDQNAQESGGRRQQPPSDIRPLLKASAVSNELNLSFYKVEEYPEEFTQCTNIKTFTFNSGKLTSLPPLTHFTSLRQLRMVKNDFTEIPASILNVVTLEELDMGNNVISTLSPAIAQLANLTELYLYVNHIKSVPREMGQMTQLRVLNLAHNFLRELPSDSIAPLVNLNQLKLSGNFLKELPKEVCALTQISDLNISRNQIRELPEDIGLLKSLQWFDAARNYISVIPESMTTLKDLEEVVVSRNRIREMPGNFAALELLLADHNKLVALPDDFNMPNLIEASFSFNCLTSLHPAIGECAELEKLELASNELSSLPDTVSKLKELTQLDVKHNSLKALPAGISSIRVKVLDVAHNQLQELPPDIWKSRSLWFVSVAENQLLKLPSPPAGTSPKISDFYGGANFFDSSTFATACAFVNIRSLDLGYSRLRTIPKEIGKLRKLANLSIAGNRVKSLSPLMKVTSLKQLYVQHNNISSLPSSVKAWAHLKILDMSHNSVSNIQALCKLDALEWLDVSHNPIKVVPEELADLPRLSVLQLLSVPVTKKALPKRLRKIAHVHNNGASRFVVSAADMQGRRDSMEDSIVLKSSLGGDTSRDLFCVFDGHGGERVAQFGGRELTGRLMNELAQSNDAVQCLRQSFLKVQEAIADTQSIGIMEGATAVAALFLKRKLFIANVGDTRAVLCRKGKAVRLSYDHKPELPEEEERIRSSGGFVADDNRVNAVLAVSRAFGDLALKRFVVCDPYISETDLYKEDQFLIIACDGIWDVLSDQQACDIVIEASKHSPATAAAVLRDFAYMYGSMDNISAVVVHFAKGCDFPKM